MNISSFLAGLTTVGFFAVLGLILTKTVPLESPPVLVLLGTLGSGWTTVLGFYFGSSMGSKQKTELMNERREGV